MSIIILLPKRVKNIQSKAASQQQEDVNLSTRKRNSNAYIDNTTTNRVKIQDLVKSSPSVSATGTFPTRDSIILRCSDIIALHTSAP